MANEYHHTPPAPTPYPDRADFGRSRQGRRRYRAALDAFHVAQRRATGRPPKSGPPIPGSEREGRRQFYTLEQCHLGGVRSGAVRRFKVRDRHRVVRDLRDIGCSLREIARRTGYHFTTASRILSGGIRSCLPLPRPLRRDGMIVPATPRLDGPYASPVLAKMRYWAAKLADMVAAGGTRKELYNWHRMLNHQRRRVEGYEQGIRRLQGDDDALAILRATDRLLARVLPMEPEEAIREMNFGFIG